MGKYSTISTGKVTESDDTVSKQKISQTKSTIDMLHCLLALAVVAAARGEMLAADGASIVSADPSRHHVTAAGEAYNKVVLAVFSDANCTVLSPTFTNATYALRTCNPLDDHNSSFVELFCPVGAGEYIYTQGWADAQCNTKMSIFRRVVYPTHTCQPLGELGYRWISCEE